MTECQNEYYLLKIALEFLLYQNQTGFCLREMLSIFLPKLSYVFLREFIKNLINLVRAV